MLEYLPCRPLILGKNRPWKTVYATEQFISARRMMKNLLVEKGILVTVEAVKKMAII